MFGFLKRDPAKKLRDSYNKKLSEAMAAQRSGDMARFAELSEEAEALLKELDAIEKNA